MKMLSLQEVVDAFDPIDRPFVKEPNLSRVAWDDLDYLAWRHPSENKAYLVAALPERNVGLLLRLGAGFQRGMCDLCCGVDRDVGSVMALIDSWARPRAALGLNICGNFECSEGARGLKFVYRMGETITAGRRIERLQENLSAFLRQVTGLYPSSAANKQL